MTRRYWNEGAVCTLDIKLSDGAGIPTRAHKYDAGLDLKAMHEVKIHPNQVDTIDTGVSVAIPPGFVGLVFSRSGFGKSNIRISLSNRVGVIDSEYRGNIKVNLENLGQDMYTIKKHERVAQLVIVPIVIPTLELFNGTQEDWEATTARGSNGFGSTGH